MASARLVFAFVALLSLIVAFQNCGPQYAAESPIANAVVSSQSVASLKSHSADACVQDSLHCIRKIYTPDSADSTVTESRQILTHTYNTRAALSECADCGPEALQFGGRYNREEVTCWVGQPGSPEALAYAMSDSMEAAAKAALQACRATSATAATQGGSK